MTRKPTSEDFDKKKEKKMFLKRIKTVVFCQSLNVSGECH